MSAHVIVVTEVPVPADEPDAEPEFDLAVECPGVTDECRTWWECAICSAALAKDDDDSYRDRLEEDGEAHGVEHRLMEFGWAVPSEDCWAQVSDDRPDAVEDVFDRAKRPIVPGRYPVHVDDGDPLTFGFVEDVVEPVPEEDRDPDPEVEDESDAVLVGEDPRIVDLQPAVRLPGHL